MKRADLERHLREHGCRLVNERGRHSKWASPSDERAPVPRHREFGTGLVRAICKQLGVPPPAAPAEKPGNWAPTPDRRAGRQPRRRWRRRSA
ncbi:MAG: type II toxin-antitoxin system HicA family toxin [Solirubrobacteraceae bacterium]